MALERTGRDIGQAGGKKAGRRPPAPRPTV